MFVFILGGQEDETNGRPESKVPVAAVVSKRELASD
jgi:hypothetical protein